MRIHTFFGAGILALIGVVTAWGSPPKVSAKYTLEISGDRTIENPTGADIEKAVEGLDTNKGDAFLVLGVSDMTYIQINGDAKVGFIMEYQEGSLKKHFTAKDENLSKEVVTAIFLKYLRADPAWKDAVSWEPLNLGG
jgi:hypothetical protein